MSNLVLAAVLLSSAPGEGVELIAHRGESFDAPENTMAAFRLAWERDVKAIELDVHLTRDGQLAVIHDADTERTAGKPKLVIKQSDLDDLRKLDVGRWKDAKWTGEPICALPEALKSIPEGARCFIEVKVGPEAVPALVEAVRGSGKRPEQMTVISFHADTVAESKRQLPELKAFYLSSFKQDEKTGAWTPGVDDLIAKAKELKADGLDLAAKGPVDAEFVRKVKDAGLELYVWTVDDPAVARRMVEAGVDGITTNRAEWLRGQLSGE